MTKSMRSVLRKRLEFGSVTESKKSEILGNREYKAWRRRALIKYLYHALISMVMAVAIPQLMRLVTESEKLIFIVALSISLGYSVLWVRDCLKVLFHRFQYIEIGFIVRKKERCCARVRVNQETQRWDVKMSRRSYDRAELGETVILFSFGNERYRAVRST